MDPKKPGKYLNLTNYLEVCAKMESKRSKSRLNSNLTTRESSGSETSGEQQTPSLGNCFKTRVNSNALEVKKQELKQDMLKLVKDLEKLNPNKNHLARYVAHETIRQNDKKGLKLKHVQSKYEALSKKYEKLPNIEKEELITKKAEEIQNKKEAQLKTKEFKLNQISKDLLIKFESVQQTFQNLTSTVETPDHALQAKSEVLAQKCDHVEQQIQLYRNDEINNVGNANNEIKAGLDQAKVCAKNLENNMQTNAVAIADKVTRAQEIEKYVELLKDEFDNIKIHNASKIDEIESKITKKKVDMENLRKEHQGVLSQVHHDHEECNNLAQQTLTELNEKKEKFKTINAQITEVQLENETLRNTNTELLLQIKGTNECDELKKLKEEDCQMKARLDAMNKDMTDIKTKLSELQSRELDLQKQREELEHNVQTVSQMKDMMEKRQHAEKRQIPTAPGGSKAPPASSEFRAPPAKMTKPNEKRTIPVAAVAGAQHKAQPRFFGKVKAGERNQGSSQRTRDELENQTPANPVLNISVAETVNSSSSSEIMPPMDVYDLNNTNASSCFNVPSKNKKRH